MKKDYDYLIVGSGLYGVTFAHLAHKHGKKCLVIDKRAHLGATSFVRVSRVLTCISMALI